MRKNKIFEVQLTNTPVQTSRLIEDATFYTSDTEAFLKFRSIDPEFSFDGATIALLNTDDASIVERPMVKENESAVYEMDLDVISHYGNWQAQVLFRKGGEIFTTPPVKFVVERYLMDERPPRLEDVESMSVLISEANAIISELEKAMSNMDFQKYDNHINDSAAHVTQANKNTWNNKQNALTTKEKEDFKRYTIVDDNGTDKTISFAVVNGQPVLRMEE